MVGGDARAALLDDVFGLAAGQQGFPFVAQHFGGLEAAVGAQVLRERPVDGAGDVASHGVHAGVLALEAFGGAGIHDLAVAVLQGGHELGGVEQGDERRALGQVAGRGGRRGFGGHRVAGALPGGNAAVEQGNVTVAQPAGQHPEPSGHGAALVVVDDELGVVRKAQCSQLAAQCLAVGQGVATQRGIMTAAEVVVDGEEVCRRDVACFPGASASLRIVEPVAAVDEHAAIDGVGQFFGGDQRCPVHGGNDVRARGDAAGASGRAPADPAPRRASYRGRTS